MTATALRVEEQAAPYLVAPLLTDHVDSFASAPEGFKQLRELVLELAAQGLLIESTLPIVPVRLGDYVELVMGQAPPGNACNKDGVGTVFVKTGEFGPLYPEVREWTTKPLKFAKRGDVLICVVGATVGKLNLAIDCAIGRSVAAIRPCPELDTTYLYYTLMPFTLKLREKSRGSAQGVIGKEELSAVLLRIPGLTEQSRIVAKVEELMALIDTLEAKVGAGETARGKLLDTLLAALADSPDAVVTAEAWAQLVPHFDLLLQTPADVDRLQQTLLQLAVKGRLVPQDPNDEPAAELLKRVRTEKERLIAEGKIRRDKPQAAIAENEEPFDPPSGWQWARFGDVFQVSGGVTLGRKLTGKRTVSYPYLRVANVQRGTLDLRQIKEVEIAEDELDRYCLRRDDLLITEGGDWDKVGRTAIWRSEIEPCLHQNHVFRARRLTKDMNVEWVALFMNSAIAMAYFQGSAKQTTNLASINMGELKHCAIPLPPLPEQSRIVAAIASLTALCDRLHERLAARRALSAKLAAALAESALA